MVTQLKKIIPVFFLFYGASLFSQTNRFIDSVEKVIITTKVDTVKILALAEVAEKCTYTDQKKAFDYSRQSIALSKKINFSRGIIRSYARLGVLYGLVSKSDSALYALNLAKTEAIKSKNKKSLAAVQNNLGMTYFDKTDYDQALANYFAALKVGEELNDMDIMASAYNNIANLHYELKDFKKALDFHLKSLLLARSMKNTFKVASSLNNIGIIYREMGEVEKAIKAFEESLVLAKEMGNKVGISLILNNLGSVYQQQKDYEKALQYFNEALEIKKLIGDKKGQAHCYHNLAEANFVLKKFDKSIEYALKSTEISKEIGNNQILYGSYKTISDAYAEKKQFEKAHRYHKLYVLYKDSVFNSNKSEQIAEMDAKYESEKKDQEIKLLNKDKDLQDATIKMQTAEAKRQATIRSGMLIGIGLIALLAVFIYRSYRIKHRSNKELSEKNAVIHEQKQSLEEKQKEILDSIHYAKRIQNTLLAHKDFIDSTFPENFIYFKPKDIISGDFYWATERDNKFFLAVCDSTGHGVPGAFMSLLNINFLNEAINEKRIEEPGKIFDYVRERLIQSVSKEGQKDGFDGILLCFDRLSHMITFAAANNKPVVVKGATYAEMETNRMPVGQGERQEVFVTRNLEVNKGDFLYLYTDGYADQFGGPKGKKFKSRQLNELLLNISTKPMQKQSEILSDAFENWRGSLEQVDDVCIIGIRL